MEPFEPGKPDYTALHFPEPPADRPWLVINMVSSLDGRVTIEGTERGLGSQADQRLMRELRFHADVVFGGAGTMRASGNSPRLGDEALERRRVEAGRKRLPLAAVLSRSGDLPTDRAFFSAEDFDAAVYLSEAASPEARARLEAAGRPVHMLPAGDEPTAMLRHMREAYGAKLAVCEGGPHLNGQLIAAGLADEFFITIAPVIVGGTDGLNPVASSWTPTIEGVPRPRLISAHPNPETGEVYLRYRLTAVD